MIDWKIEPQVGVGPLKFGMSPAEVATILGLAERTLKIADKFIGMPELKKKFKDDTSEYRMFGDVKTMKPTISYRSNKMNYISFEKSHDTLSIFGMNLFKTTRSKVIERLTTESKSVLITDNEYTLYFMDLGISMANIKPSRIEPQISVWIKHIYSDLYTNSDYLVIKS